MNDPTQHDQLWAEAVSLLSAGCLPPEDERAARQHLDTCAACRERFRQLVAVCDGLDASRPANLECAPELANRVVAAISTNKPRPTIFEVHRRWAAALAASLMLALTLRSFLSPRRQIPELAHRPQPQLAPPGEMPATVFHEPPGPPTLFTYERSFALSGEATESLLDEEARRLSFLSAPKTREAAMKELLQ